MYNGGCVILPPVVEEQDIDRYTLLVQVLCCIRVNSLHAHVLHSLRIFALVKLAVFYFYNNVFVIIMYFTREDVCRVPETGMQKETIYNCETCATRPNLHLDKCFRTIILETLLPTKLLHIKLYLLLFPVIRVFRINFPV